jgi:O-acetylhomoserine (thiol)-lyase
MKSKHRYRTLVEPNASYSGMVLGEVFGNMAFAIAARSYAVYYLSDNPAR